MAWPFGPFSRAAGGVFFRSVYGHCSKVTGAKFFCLHNGPGRGRGRGGDVAGLFLGGPGRLPVSGGDVSWGNTPGTGFITTLRFLGSGGRRKAVMSSPGVIYLPDPLVSARRARSGGAPPLAGGGVVFYFGVCGRLAVIFRQVVLSGFLARTLHGAQDGFGPGLAKVGLFLIEGDGMASLGCPGVWAFLVILRQPGGPEGDAQWLGGG